jgi:hypothetical protein
LGKEIFLCYDGCHNYNFETGRMNDVMTKRRRTQPTAKQLRLMALRDAMLADWRKRWPAAFTKPVPLAVGIDEQMKAVLHAEGQTIDRMGFHAVQTGYVGNTLDRARW